MGKRIVFDYSISKDTAESQFKRDRNCQVIETPTSVWKREDGGVSQYAPGYLEHEQFKQNERERYNATRT